MASKLVLVHTVLSARIYTRSVLTMAGRQADRQVTQDISLKMANGFFAPGCLKELEAADAVGVVGRRHSTCEYVTLQNGNNKRMCVYNNSKYTFR